MPILVDCPGCRRKLRVPDATAGRRGRCPRCDSAFVVPDLPDDFPSFLPIEADDGPVRLSDHRPTPLPPPPSPGPYRPQAWRFGFPGPMPGQYESAQRVVVIDFDMPFGSMVSFLFRWTLAAFVVGLAFAAIFLVIALALSLLLALFGRTLGNLPR